VTDTELLKIGDFARLAGTNLRTLRYYEELGLLEAAERSQGGFRYYRRTDVNRLKMIRDLQDLGLALERIRDLMATRQYEGDRPGFFEQVRAALAEQDRLLVERVATLERQRERIQEALSKIRQCVDCKVTPSAANNYCEPCRLTGEPLPETISALY
jgi:DNA-binding transcriptional MerR regulator